MRRRQLPALPVEFFQPEGQTVYQLLVGFAIVLGAALFTSTHGAYATILVAAVALSAGVLFRELMSKFDAQKLLELFAKSRADATGSRAIRKLRIRCAIAGQRLLRNSFVRTYIWPDFRPHFNQAREWQMKIARFLLAAVGMLALLHFGASPWFWVPWVFLFPRWHFKFQTLIQNSAEDGYRGFPYWLFGTWIGQSALFYFCFSSPTLFTEE
jgi:hypothetical protein